MKRDTICEALIVFCAIVNVYLFVNKIWLTRSANEQHKDVFSYVGDDYPEYLPLDRPLQPGVPMTIQPLPGFPISGPGAIEKWESIYPPGHGYVRLGDHSRLLCVAMFHQLHCIDKMHVFLDDPSNKHVSFPHLHHCMNYLRQLFLCKADITLEPLEGGLSVDEALDPDVDLSMKSGTGMTRYCRDWETIQDIVGENYMRWKSAWNISEPQNKDDIARHI